jgi:putative membrane protein
MASTSSNDLRSIIPVVPALESLSLWKGITAIMAVSVAAFAFLLWILYVKPASAEPGSWVYMLPTLNASLNSIATVMILAGYAAIRRRNFKQHMTFMIAAFVASSLFLVSYLVYHNSVGHTVFQGEGFVRVAYLTLLISHIILSATVVPFVLTSYYMVFSGRFSLHRKVSKWTFPVWLYVSVTGPSGRFLSGCMFR